MTFPVPADNALLYEQITIGGKLWSGLCDVEGCDREWEWQIQKAVKAGGAKLNFMGLNIPTVKLRFTLWKGTDGLNYVDYFEQWDKFEPSILVTVDDKDPKAITIEQPQFARAGIRSVVAKKISDLQFQPDGRVIIEVEVLPFLKPKPSGGTVKEEAKGVSDLVNDSAKPRSKAWDMVDNKIGELGRKMEEFETKHKAP